MNILIPGTAILTFPVDEVEVDNSTFSLDDGSASFEVSYSWNHSSVDGQISASMRGSLTVTKEEVEAEAGKPFDRANKKEISRAIRRAVVEHVKASIK